MVVCAFEESELVLELKMEAKAGVESFAKSPTFRVIEDPIRMKEGRYPPGSYKRL